jgi:hypothetical protein
MRVKASKAALSGSGTELLQGEPSPQASTSVTNVQQGDPAPQALSSVANATVGQATSVAQSRPRRAAAAASTGQGGAARGPRTAAAASTEVEKSTSATSDPPPLYGPNGEIWECRPLPNIMLDLMQPVQKHVPDTQCAAHSDSLLIFLP